MGTTQSGAAAGEGGVGGGADDAAPEQPPTMESMMKALHGEQEVQRQRVINLLGLDVSEGKDEVVWLEKSLGLQSRCFLVRGERWKGRGKQPVVDPTAVEKNTAFVKVLPRWNIKDMIADIRRAARDDAEKSARALGKTEEEVKAAGEQASEEVDVVEFTEPSLQMVRERQVLRAWQAAEEAGELKLPDDSLLVIPRLFDNVFTGPDSTKEEDKPTMLVFEDLVAAGFEVRSYKEAISVEDAVAVSGALADLHAALWRIRERLGFGDSVQETGTAVPGQSTANVGAGKYEKMLRESLEELRQVEAYKKLVDLVDPFVPDIVAGAADHDLKPKVLGHGDPWAHNVMLRRDTATGLVNGVAFVDLGNVRMVHPLEDFFCFLGTMAIKDAWQVVSPVREVFESRLKKQMPAEMMSDAAGNGLELFSYRNQMHGRAAMLVFFFDHGVWRITNTAGFPEPARRQVAAFAGVARVAEKRKQEQSTSLDIEVQVPAHAARLRKSTEKQVPNK